MGLWLAARRLMTSSSGSSWKTGNYDRLRAANRPSCRHGGWRAALQRRRGQDQRLGPDDVGTAGGLQCFSYRNRAVRGPAERPRCPLRITVGTAGDQAPGLNGLVPAGGRGE
jgi:hypothetical protein